MKKLFYWSKLHRLSLKTSELVLDLPSLKYDDIYSNPLILLKSTNLEIYKYKIIFFSLLERVKMWNLPLWL
jgi:hypothetical protein